MSSGMTIKSLFSDFLQLKGDMYQFSIPLYQREYSWGEQQWKDTLDDLMYSFNRLGTDYWGNILVYENTSKKEFELVDGQQRLITLLLLISALGSIEKNNGYLPLKFHGQQNDVWIKIAENSKLSQNEKRHRFNNVRNFFIKKIKELKCDKNELLEYLYKTKISVVVVDNVMQGNLLFARLNIRGISLNDIDMIKHRIFYLTDRRQPPTGHDVVFENWNKLAKITRDMNVSVEMFITNWWKVHYDISEELYKSFLEKMITSEECMDFLNSLLNVARGISDTIKNDSGNDNRIGRNLKWLLKISKSKELWMVIIALHETIISKQEKALFYEALTVFEFARSISDKDFFDIDLEYRDFSKEILKKRKGKPIPEREVITKIKNLKIIMGKKLSDYGEFIDNFKGLRFIDGNIGDSLKYERMLSKYAIYTLNNWLDESNHGAGVEYRTRDDDEYSIEHIRAKKNAKSDDSPEYLIGNLVVFEKQLNNDLGDVEVCEKISKYKKSSYPQMKEFLYKSKRKGHTKTRENNLMEWDKEIFDKDDIECRGRYLAKCFYKQIKKILKTV